MIEKKKELSLADSVVEDLTINNIIKKVPELALWRYYIGSNFTLEKPFNAPYRTDYNASFSLKYDHRNRLMFKDFGRPGMYGDIFNYLQQTLNISFLQSLEKVNHDFNLNLISKIGVKDSNGITKSRLTKEELNVIVKEGQRLKENSQKNILIQAVVRSWVEEDLKYWNNYGISQATLKKYFVFPADKVFKDKYLVYNYIVENPCYIYYFPKSKHVKCYLPFNPDKGRRFFGNVNNFEDIQGYYQCNVKEGKKENKLLILTKSMKDVMLLREFGIDAMALHGENHRFEADFIRHIKKYYGKIVSLYDRDKAGILGAKKLWKDHNIMPFLIQKKWYCKDISDMFMTYGNEVVRDFLVSLTNNINKQVNNKHK